MIFVWEGGRRVQKVNMVHEIKMRLGGAKGRGLWRVTGMNLLKGVD